MHIIFRKPQDYPPIPKNWLHKQRFKIWGSWNTAIEEIPYSNVDRMSHYVIGKYFVNQLILRLSYGHEWVFSGFVMSFRKIIDAYAFMKQSPDTPDEHKPFKRAIKVWNKNINSGCFRKTVVNVLYLELLEMIVSGIQDFIESLNLETLELLTMTLMFGKKGYILSGGIVD